MDLNMANGFRMGGFVLQRGCIASKAGLPLLPSGASRTRNTNFMELLVRSRNIKAGGVFAAAGLALLLTGCNATKTLQLTPGETLTHGYVIDQATIDMVPVGSSREQVLLALGSPSTTATFDNEVLYYISQIRSRPVAFMNPKIVDQRVLAIYMGADGRVANVAHYGMQDGKLFDFVSRTTPTAGKDQNFLGQLITGVAGTPQLPSGR
jgi:outer membrane protein assembly factor BamE (lipoprotein component of BamABCDE complex)